MFCKYCGSQIPDDSAFCKKCGKSLEEKDKTPAPAEDKKTREDKKRRKLPVVLGITIPVVVVLTIVALIFTDIIPFPLLDQERTETDSAEELKIATGDSETQDTTVQEEPQEETQEPAQEEPEEIQLDYHPECEISFYEENTFEISNEGLDQGYPNFKFIYPDGWEAQEEPFLLKIGYPVLFISPDFVEIEIGGYEPWEQPLIDERVIILNEEYSSLPYKEVVDSWYSSPMWTDSEIEVLQYDNIDEEVFIIIWQEPGGNKWWVQYRFTEINGYTFMHGVSAIDHCYDPWSDILVNTIIEERLVIEEKTVEEYVEEETEGPQVTKPTIGLEVIEGPISEEGVCYYRVAANTGGTPAPNITFNRDDSNGAWGAGVAQVNLTNPNDSFTLTATAANAVGSATDSLLLSWGCEVPKDENNDEPEEEESNDSMNCPEITSMDIYNFYEPPSSSIDPSEYQNPGDDWVWVKANISGDKSGLDYQWLPPSGYIVESYGNFILWDVYGESGSFDITLNINNSSGCSDSFTQTFYRG
ncbi:zinc-ribbon domain-containing protein [Candidatus Poribacteria bacterium]|nr:zinc-ribbon domain-containing protein [Candidatus Poribacteria bacterium]